MTVVLLAGSVSAWLAARNVAADRDTERANQFESSSAEVTSALHLAIAQEQDLVLAVGGFIVGMPAASNRDFVRWATSVQALQRHPEVLGLGQVVDVPARELASFASKAAADPAVPLPPDGSFQVVPTGNRAQYCLLTKAQWPESTATFPAGYDYCAGNLGTAAFAARDSGAGAYLPIQGGTFTALVIMTPVYRGGTVPASVDARRQAFLGWVGLSVAPEVLLQHSLAGHRGIAVRMQYKSNSSNVSFQSGTIAMGAHSKPIDLHNGWTLTTFGAAAETGILANASAFTLLVVGLLATALLATLLTMLATQRLRALALVDTRTDQLRHQAMHDALTGLPNRVLILDRIEQLLVRNERNGTTGAALYLDLDGFKNVNDTLGHDVGDRLLQAVATRLTATLRDADTIGRMGGDEFVVLIDGASLQTAPELVAERILEVMRTPFHVGGAANPIAITASVGIATGHGVAPGELLREADMALYQAKAAGKDCHETFGEQMGDDIQHRYELEFDLRRALDDNQFRLLYQPMYDLHDLSVAGVEALLRWQHPVRGLIAPDDFIPLLESSGQIVDVGNWVLREACAQMAAWRAMGHNLSVSVNVSGRQLDRDSIVEHVKEALDASGLEPAALTIEITETALMCNIDLTTRRLRELKALGVKVAIDDFGTGYSSLAYLQRFPVDCLKIDKSFTDTIAQSPEADALIATLLQLGADLGLKTVAEGVESQNQVDYLRSENVDEVQGFLFAKPLTAVAVEAELRRPMTARRGGIGRSRPGSHGFNTGTKSQRPAAVRS